MQCHSCVLVYGVLWDLPVLVILAVVSVCTGAAQKFEVQKFIVIKLNEVEV